MQIIIFSGGSGTRLWPLSNEARSKQFLRLLPGPDGKQESMIQRVIRQIRHSGIEAEITVATSESQRDSVFAQLGNEVDIVTEPERRKTFPAISLAARYLKDVKGCGTDEITVIMPCDPYTGMDYYRVISRLAKAAADGRAELMLMGIAPTYPSAKYGYALPGQQKDGITEVRKFIEKPSAEEAEKLIDRGAMWNGGVFACRLGYLVDLADKYVGDDSFEKVRAHYNRLPVISFDCEVVEKASSVAMLPYYGPWKDLGTWNTLTDELAVCTYGNVTTDGTTNNTHIFNELDIPMLCLGTSNLVIAASPDGILVTEKSKSENIKKFSTELQQRPMYEERRWGVYRVIDHTEDEDGHCSLTKRLTLTPGASISYQKHACRDEVWTFIDGEGEIVIDGVRSPVQRGSVAVIKKGQMHALRAITPLSFIEVQSGNPLVESDIERFPFEW